MYASDYQRGAARTLIAKPGFTPTLEQLAIISRTLRIAVAASALEERVKKGIFHEHGLTTMAIHGGIARIERRIAELAEIYDEESDESLDIVEPSAGQLMALWNVIGVGGEAGELQALVEGWVFGGEELDRKKVLKESGDILWYVASLLTVLGLSLGDAMEGNLEKLRRRYPEGFDPQASLNRKE